jgi:general secretion pathway protein N
MRADSAGAKTWLLGAVALWALVVWALGLFGLGGRIERLAEDPSLLQALPRGVPAVDERLGPLPQYAEIGDRPLFTNDRRPQPFFINPQGEGEEPETFEYVLTSVLRVPGLEMAILHPQDGSEPVRLRIGESPEGASGWRLASIAPRSVVFDGPEGETTLELRVFDGVGGEPPTAMAEAPAENARARPDAARPRRQPVPRPGERGAGAVVPVTTSSSPAPVPVYVPEPDAGDAADAASDAEEVRTPDAQVEAIRQRIEARRAQQRQQAQQPPAASPDENP